MKFSGVSRLLTRSSRRGQEGNYCFQHEEGNKMAPILFATFRGGLPGTAIILKRRRLCGPPMLDLPESLPDSVCDVFRLSAMSLFL
ncbi:hypothetical protein CGGC5_v017111 [Colletotrichum fructicola Nara gc5]|uniref:Uncharacterized protein n=1 Tax=Colletotrichum fructicola (strain Nara gc5) TaxID=1213859 RepID=A0A7J6IEV9_COLFN|nr:hypothetical protein CGGC5_v016987 [Colletotrichum fructicola Nara gc5]KAF4474364.1 hypothetical protein CGGC5_v017111 [Colletotrichum fructicola Nara gc5]